MRAGWIFLALVLAAVLGQPSHRSLAQQMPQSPGTINPAANPPRLPTPIDPNSRNVPAEQLGALADIREFESGNWRVVCRPGGESQVTIRVLERDERIRSLPAVAAWRLEMTFRRASAGFLRTALAPGECAMPSAAIPIAADEIRFVRVIDAYRTGRLPMYALDSVSYANGIFRVR